MHAHQATANFVRRWIHFELRWAVDEPGFAHADATSSLRADLKIAELGDHLYGIYVDYTSVHPNAPTHRNNAIAGKLFQKREQTKHAKFATVLGPGERLIPFVIDVLGGIGPAAQRLVGELARELQDRKVDPIGPIRQLRYGLARTHRTVFLPCTRPFASQHSQVPAVFYLPLWILAFFSAGSMKSRE